MSPRPHTTAFKPDKQMPRLAFFLLLLVLCHGWGAAATEAQLRERYERYVRDFGKVCLLCGWTGEGGREGGKEGGEAEIHVTPSSSLTPAPTSLHFLLTRHSPRFPRRKLPSSILHGPTPISRPFPAPLPRPRPPPPPPSPSSTRTSAIGVRSRSRHIFLLRHPHGRLL